MRSNRQARRSWIVLLATVAVTFVAMRLRVMWLADAGDTLSIWAPLIDRYAFVARGRRGHRSAGVAFRRSLACRSPVCLTALMASIAAGIVRAGLLRGRRAAPRAAGGGRRDRPDRACCGFHVIGSGLGRRLKRTARCCGG